MIVRRCRSDRSVPVIDVIDDHGRRVGPTPTDHSGKALVIFGVASTPCTRDSMVGNLLQIGYTCVDTSLNLIRDQCKEWCVESRPKWSQKVFCMGLAAKIPKDLWHQIHRGAFQTFNRPSKRSCKCQKRMRGGNIHHLRKASTTRWAMIEGCSVVYTPLRATFGRRRHSWSENTAELRMFKICHSNIVLLSRAVLSR